MADKLRTAKRTKSIMKRQKRMADKLRTAKRTKSITVWLSDDEYSQLVANCRAGKISE